MTCLICAGHAHSVECATGWEERHCSECGGYRISQLLILAMMDQGQIFDTSKMREWLTTQRSLMPTSIIEPHHALRLS
ncbi:hypothetical protein E8E68_22645 [Pseudomonas sp. BN607]|nr:hypothetical protein [Pseudomonas sp. BN607]